MMLRFCFFILAIVTLVLCGSYSSMAKKENLRLDVDASYDDVVMPELYSTSILIDNDSERPQEPNIAPVSFRKLDEHTGVNHRLQKIFNGIKNKVPPEYDHFGYEIRRYMSRVGNVEIFDDDDTFLREQIKNVKKAAVIADYWKKDLQKELDEIGEILSADELADKQYGIEFRRVKSEVTTFMISLHGWIESNHEVLMYIFDNPRIFYVDYPEIVIRLANERVDFYNLLIVRQTKLKSVREKYLPFEIMVY